MLGLFGFLIVGIIVFLLLKKITVPSIAFIAVPTVMVLIAGFAGFLPESALMNGKILEKFSFLTVGRFIREGVRGTYETAVANCLYITACRLIWHTFSRFTGIDLW